jgi:hypothetical protein
LLGLNIHTLSESSGKKPTLVVIQISSRGTSEVRTASPISLYDKGEK